MLPNCPIRVQSTHHLEFVIPNSNNDDAHGKRGGLLHYQVYGLVHVVDLSISQYEKDVVDLLRHLCFNNTQHLF